MRDVRWTIAWLLSLVSPSGSLSAPPARVRVHSPRTTAPGRLFLPVRAHAHLRRVPGKTLQSTADELQAAREEKTRLHECVADARRALTVSKCAPAPAPARCGCARTPWRTRRGVARPCAPVPARRLRGFARALARASASIIAPHVCARIPAGQAGRAPGAAPGACRCVTTRPGAPGKGCGSGSRCTRCSTTGA